MPYRKSKEWGTKKPPLGTPVNTSDPLTVGLRAAYLFAEDAGGTAVNSIRTDSWGSVKVPGSAWASGRGGPAFTTDGGTTKQYVDIGSSLPASLNLTGECTILALCHTNTLVTSPPCSIVSDFNSSGTSSQWHYDLNRAGAGLLSVWWGGAQQLAGSTAITTTGWYTLGMSRAGSTGAWTANTWINGRLDATQGSIATNPAAQQGSSIGRLGQFDGQYFNGLFEYVFVWARALSPSDVLQVHVTPYRMFATPRRRIISKKVTATWPFIQKNSQGFANSASARTLAYSSNVTSGSLLTIMVGTFAAGSPTVTVSDNINGSWTQAGSYAINGSNVLSCWYFKNAGAGATTVTVTPSASVQMGLGIQENSTPAPSSSVVLDNAVTNTGSSTTPTTGTVSVTGTTDLVLAGFCDPSVLTSITVAGPFALQNTVEGATGENIGTADDENATASEGATFTKSANAVWAAIGASWKIQTISTRQMLPLMGVGS